MVAAVSETINSRAQGGVGHQNPKRPPLLPSEPDNALNSRRPKSRREVSSRYLSSSVSSTSSSSSVSSSPSVKRCSSPLVLRNSQLTAMATPIRAVPSAIKRSQSVERRRAVTPRPNSLDLRMISGSRSNVEMTAAQKMLCTSTRTLSVSFQGESFSYQVSKAKPAPSPSVTRKGTPERRKLATTPGRGVDQTENSKAERWPGRLRRADSMSRSVGCTDEGAKLSGSGSSNVVRPLQDSIVDNRTSVDSGLSSSSASMNVDSPKKVETSVQHIGSDSQCDHVASDTESVSSGRASGGQESSVRNIIVPARFKEEPGSPMSNKTSASVKFIAPRKFGFESPVSSPKGLVNSRGQISPIRGPARPSSPRKLGPPSSSTPMRGVSPSRVRTAVLPSSNSCNTQSFLSFAADIKRGKIGEARIFDAHLLRLFHNRLLQWRYVNARADAAQDVQSLTAERDLYNTWILISRLRESVKTKRIELQMLRQNLKLVSILKGQLLYLEEWALQDGNYSGSLLEITEALRASTLRLPVVGGARADIRKLNDAICSAISVMQAMASSVCSLMSKVGDANSLLTELTNVRTTEHALLNQCRDLLSSIAAMQVTECSMRTHIIQTLQHFPSTMTTQM